MQALAPSASSRASTLLGLSLSLGLAASSLPACKDTRAEAAQRSLAQLPGHVRAGREAVTRFVSGFAPLLTSLADGMVEPVAAANADRVRFQLIGLRTRQTSAGSLSLFPTGFVAAVGADGVVIARDQPADDDRMRGMNLGPLFASVRGALEGNAGTSVGELPATTDQPSRVYLVAAAPLRNPAANNAVVGALVAGVSYGQLARSIETALRTSAGADPVLWVGLRRGDRVLPSGPDRDVPPRWLVPPTLLAQVPASAAATAASPAGQATWTFIENGQRGWAGALASLPELDGTLLLLYRSEAQQR